MKGLIAAGGRGTRLRPITYTSNKHLVPIANRPMILYPIKTLLEVGVTDIIIVTGEDSIPEFKSMFGDGSKLGAKFTYIAQPYPGGLGHVIQCASEYLKGDSFIYHLGDNIFGKGIRGQVNLFNEKGYDGLVTYKRVDVPKRELKRWGLVELYDNGSLKEYHEKPDNPPTNLASAGLYIFKPQVLDYLDEWKPSDRGEIEISEVYNVFLKKGANIGSYEIKDWWNDPGKMDDLIKANRDVLSDFDIFKKKGIDVSIGKDTKITGNVIIEKGTKVKNSVIRGPVVIGRDCVIKNSYIGPYTSIYHGCEIINSELENSVLLEGAEISDVDFRIDYSLLGKGAKIVKHDHRPRSLNFLLGDTSIVDLT